MIKIENVKVVGWEHAIIGMRNPMNSWEKLDSVNCVPSEACSVCEDLHTGRCYDGFVIGNNDLDLMKRLRNAGTDHRKFMRMITVYVDIYAPIYWWKEFDTYKVGTVANSCSTMHKIHAKEFTLDDFSHEHLMDSLIEDIDGNDVWCSPLHMMEQRVAFLNLCREKYLETEDKKYWWQMIQLLPSSYNQRRTVMLNYEVLANMYRSRKSHKLDEWVEFCEWIKTLPYSELIIGGE